MAGILCFSEFRSAYRTRLPHEFPLPYLPLLLLLVLLVHLLFPDCQSSTSRSETGYDFVHQDSLVMVRKISLAHDSALDPLKLSQSPLTDTPNLNDPRRMEKPGGSQHEISSWPHALSRGRGSMWLQFYNAQLTCAKINSYGLNPFEWQVRMIQK